MIGSYQDSVARGTAANRLTQAKAYLSFSTYYCFNPLHPSTTNLCMFVQFLKNSFSAPTTVKNYLSGARTWLSEHGGSLMAFGSFEYHQITSGITKRSQHIPRRAAPLSWEHIRKIGHFLDTTSGIPLAAKPCLLIGYHTLLRAGNLLSPTMNAWGGPHTLSAKDINLSDKGITITVHSTKTKYDSTPAFTTIPWQEIPQLCPAMAWMRYAATIKPWSLGPAFLTDNHLPLTPKQMTGFMRLALMGSEDIDPTRVSMHSLRRGAAQSAQQAGLSLDRIKDIGMWRSDTGVSPYLN